MEVGVAAVSGGGGESAGGSSGGLWSAYLGLLQSQPVSSQFLSAHVQG